ATETLSLGIHMPARACVVSSFTKFDGRDFMPLTPGELTQLMGRAGRRGIDPIGHGVILKEPDVDIGTIFEAATGEEMTVESKFAPTYNMALNLLRYHPPDQVDLLMERSFGQYQKLVARRELDGRLANLHQRLADVTATRFQAQGQPCCTERSQGEYRRRMHALRGVLEELGFLEAAQPTEKGLLASRIYGENSLIITEAIADGWLEELTPPELAAALVMVTAEDRNRDRPRERRRFPTSAIALAQKRLRIIYYRFSAREKARGEENLRPLST